MLGGGAAILVSGTLTAAGFTSTGIAAATAATVIQSYIGSVAAGSTFAVLQSVGATGLIATVGVAGASVFVISGTGYLIYKIANPTPKL